MTTARTVPQQAPHLAASTVLGEILTRTGLTPVQLESVGIQSGGAGKPTPKIKPPEPATVTRVGPPALEDAPGVVEGVIRSYCILPAAAYLPLATWALATWAQDSFDCFPYLAILSPVKGCGKTRLLECLELMVANPRRVAGASVAATFRELESAPTMLLDEVESLKNQRGSESAQAILAILNAGHRRGATVTRCQPPDWKVHHFSVYGPKAFASIGALSDTLMDRCIVVTMQRRRAHQSVSRFLFARARAEAEPIRECLEAWRDEYGDSVREVYRATNDLPFLFRFLETCRDESPLISDPKASPAPEESSICQIDNAVQVGMDVPFEPRGNREVE